MTRATYYTYSSHTGTALPATLFSIGDRYRPLAMTAPDAKITKEVLPESSGSPPIVGSTTTLDHVVEANRLCDLGGIAFRAGDYTDAASLYRRALDRVAGRDAETSVKLRRNLAAALARTGEWREVLRLADDVLRDAPADARALLRRAEASTALGNFDQAREAIELGARGADRAAAAAFAAAKAKLDEAERRDSGTHAALCRRLVAAPE
jgi:tetratricopeptide (TPR) repeat protein